MIKWYMPVPFTRSYDILSGMMEARQTHLSTLTRANLTNIGASLLLF
jgi:hypothetical protein